LTKELKTYVGEKTACSTNDVGKTGYPYAEDSYDIHMKLDPYLLPCTKITSKIDC
jgi:hypothetical protein